MDLSTGSRDPENDWDMACTSDGESMADEPPSKKSCLMPRARGVKMMARKLTCNFGHRDDEQTKLRLVLDSEDCSSHSIKVAITGPPGVGKTELAISVITESYHHFDHIIWINCGSEENIRLDLTLAANLLGIPITVGLDLPILIHKIYQHCSDYKCLFIFDNVTDHESFTKFLPNYVSNKSSIFILVTSFYRDWDSEYKIHLKPFDTSKSQVFLKKMLPEISNSQASKLSCYLGGIPFVLQLAISYIKQQKVLKSIEGSCEFTTEDFIKDLIRGTRALRQHKMHESEKVGYCKSLETLYEDLITNLQKEPKGELAFNLYLKINLIKYEEIPISLFKLKSDNDLRINDAFLLLEKYSIVTCCDRKFHRSYFLPYIALYNFAHVLDTHKTNLYNLFLDKCIDSTSFYGTLMLENGMYLPHAKKFFQVLTTTSILKVCSKIPFIIVNSDIMDFQETILFIDSYFKKLEIYLGWNNIDYIGIQTILIKCHFKLKHHLKVLELCTIAESKLPETYKYSNFNLHILHYKASSLHKVGQLKEAYILAKYVYEKRLLYHGALSHDYLASLRRMCAIVAKLYEDGDTIALTLFKTICNKCLVDSDNHLSEKIQFISELEKYFTRMGRQDDLLPIFDHFHDFLIESKGPDSNISLLLLVMKACYLCGIGEVDNAWTMCIYLVEKLHLDHIFIEQPNQVVMLDFIESLELQVNERL